MRLPLVTFCALAVLSRGRALANTDSAQAEALFEQGIALMDAGKLDQACSAFDASQKIAPVITTLLNQADCREKNEQLATAWGHFLDAERQTRNATDADGRRYHELADARAAALRPRVSTLTIRVAAASEVPGLVITRNGTPVERVTWNQPLAVDRGNYTITAHASDYLDWSTTVSVAPANDSQQVEVPAPVAAPRPRTPPQPPADPSVVSLAPSDVRTRRVPILTSTVALGLGATALAFELWARSVYRDGKAETTDQAERDDLEHGANVRRYVAEGLAVAGVGVVAVAIWQYVRGTTEAPRRSSLHLRLSPQRFAASWTF